MDDDPEKRIADLERQLAEQKRIAELERQLADARASAGQAAGGEQQSMPWDGAGPDAARIRAAMSSAAAQAGMSQAQLDDALSHAKVTIRTGRSTVYSGGNWTPQFFGQQSYSPPTFGQPPFGRRRTMNAGARIGGLVGLLGGCLGGAAALTAVFPSSALWTSRIVCGGPNQLMINTSHYSYKPGQSGTNIGFTCVGADGTHDASFLAVGGLQMLVVVLVVSGLIALGYLVKRLRRRQPLKPVTAIAAGGLGVVSLVVLVAVTWSAIAGASAPTQIPRGGSLTVRGNGETKTIACNDGHLTIDGRAENITVTGHCAKLSVDGVVHQITIDSADAIEMDGLNNHVIYHSGKPTVTNSGGANNSVKQG
jgi:hypothetical protein